MFHGIGPCNCHLWRAVCYHPMLWAGSHPHLLWASCCHSNLWRTVALHSQLWGSATVVNSWHGAHLHVTQWGCCHHLLRAPNRHLLWSCHGHHLLLSSHGWAIVDGAACQGITNVGQWGGVGRGSRAHAKRRQDGFGLVRVVDIIWRCGIMACGGELDLSWSTESNEPCKQVHHTPYSFRLLVVYKDAIFSVLSTTAHSSRSAYTSDSVVSNQIISHTSFPLSWSGLPPLSDAAQKLAQP